MTGIVYQLISMFAFGISNALWRKPVDKMQVEEAIFYRTIHSVFFFIILLFSFSRFSIILENISNISYLKNIGFSLVISVLSFFGLFFFNKALQKANTSLVVIVATLSFLFGQFTAFVLLNETFNPKILVALVLFLITIILSDWKSIQNFKISKAVWFGILAALIWGTTLPLLSVPVKQIGFVETGFILELSVLLMSFVIYRFYFKKHLHLSNIKSFYPYFLFLGILAGTGVLFMNLSYTEIPVHIAGAISSSTHLITIFISVLFFKETINKFQIFASITAFIAIFYTISIL